MSPLKLIHQHVKITRFIFRRSGGRLDAVDSSRLFFQSATKRSIRVSFFGFYGRHNFGDDLFCYLLERICDDISHVDACFVGATKLQELKRGWRLPFVEPFAHSNRKYGTFARFLGYCVALGRADVAVFGGGSLFGASASVAFPRLITSWGRMFGIPVHAIGVSVGPFISDKRRQQFLYMLDGIDKIAVRDWASIHEMKTSSRQDGVANLGDLAYALPSIYAPKRIETAGRTLIVSVHLRQYSSQVLAMLKAVDRNRWADRVLFLSLDAESAQTNDSIKDSFNPQNMMVDSRRYAESIEEVVDLLASAACVVTSKLHGAIASYVYDVPTMLFCYQKKCADFLKDNDLPGPRNPIPLESECVAVVETFLADRPGNRIPFLRGQQYRDSFTNFLANISRTGSLRMSTLDR